MSPGPQTWLVFQNIKGFILTISQDYLVNERAFITTVLKEVWDYGLLHLLDLSWSTFIIFDFITNCHILAGQTVSECTSRTPRFGRHLYGDYQYTRWSSQSIWIWWNFWSQFPGWVEEALIVSFQEGQGVPINRWADDYKSPLLWARAPESNIVWIFCTAIQKNMSRLLFDILCYCSTKIVVPATLEVRTTPLKRWETRFEAGWDSDQTRVQHKISFFHAKINTDLCGEPISYLVWIWFKIKGYITLNLPESQPHMPPESTAHVPGWRLPACADGEIGTDSVSCWGLGRVLPYKINRYHFGELLHNFSGVVRTKYYQSWTAPFGQLSLFGDVAPKWPLDAWPPCPLWENVVMHNVCDQELCKTLAINHEKPGRIVALFFGVSPQGIHLFFGNAPTSRCGWAEWVGGPIKILSAFDPWSPNIFENHAAISRCSLDPMDQDIAMERGSQLCCIFLHSKFGEDVYHVEPLGHYQWRTVRPGLWFCHTLWAY